MKSFATIALFLCALIVGCSKEDGSDSKDSNKTNQNRKAAAPYLSPDYIELAKKQEQARQEGKNLIIVSSAAWWGPCAWLAPDLETPPGVMTRLRQSHVIVHVEEMMLAPGLFDLFAFEQTYYPLIVYFETDKGIWHP